MDMNRAITAFAALGQESRLAAFRLLVQAGPEGMPAGEIAQALDARQNTMSANLAVLLRAGLVRRDRHGREIRYQADLEGMRSLLGYLMEDCCGGSPALCQPVIDAIACDAATETTP